MKLAAILVIVIYTMILHSATATLLENSGADCSLFTLCKRYIKPLTKSAFKSGLLPVATLSAADITMPRKYLHLLPAPRTRFDGKIPQDVTFVLFEQILVAAPLAILMAVGILLWSCRPCLSILIGSDSRVTKDLNEGSYGYSREGVLKHQEYN
ncbi:hypothetical protein OROMI_034854 [Orobanche minor]